VTIPETSDDPQYVDVVFYAHPLLDYLTLYRATAEEIERLEEKGVPRSKIVWGLAIGCNESMVFDDVPLEDAVKVAEVVGNGGYAGVTTWSMNRDTDARFEDDGCIALQTGLPDGSFIFAIADQLE